MCTSVCLCANKQNGWLIKLRISFIYHRNQKVFLRDKQVFFYSLLDTCTKKKTLRVPIFSSSKIDSPNNLNDVVNKNSPLNSRMYICYSLNILVKFNLWSYWYRRGDPAWGVTLRCSVYGLWLSGERVEDGALRYSLEASNQMVRVRERVWGPRAEQIPARSTRSLIGSADTKCFHNCGHNNKPNISPATIATIRCEMTGNRLFSRLPSRNRQP